MNNYHTDHHVLRELAWRVAEIAALPRQQETIALWKAHNALKPLRPMVMIDQIPWHEMNVNDELTLCCQDPFCQKLETDLRRTLYRWRHMAVDFVVEPFVRVDKAIQSTGYGVQTTDETAVLDPQNDVVGHRYIDQLPQAKDIEKIHAPEIRLDERATLEAEERSHDIFDGILDVYLQGVTPVFAPWDIIVQWRNPETLLYDMIDRPEFLHQIARRLLQAQLGMLEQMESSGLLGGRQSWIHCTGAFTDELNHNPDRPQAKDLWTFGMSQMFSTLSPVMHEEFEHPYLAPWFQRFGLAYYGCCEPLDAKVAMIRRLPNVRKVSMSPWVEVERGAQQLGRDYVFSRKPSPALLARDEWRPDLVTQDLLAAQDACRRHGCPLEFILKDISTVHYQPQRLWEWSDIATRVACG